MVQSKGLAVLGAMLGLFLTQAANAEIKCTAIHEWLNPQGHLEHEEKELKTVFQSKEMLSLETDLDGRNFSLKGDPAGEEFLLLITQGPDYTKGAVTNATFNASGALRVSTVDGTVVHKLACRR